MSLLESLLNPPSQPGQTRASRGTGMAGDLALSRAGRRLRADTLRRRSETGGGIRHRPADDPAGRQDLLDQFSALRFQCVPDGRTWPTSGWTGTPDPCR
jgi:hypothetical protein